MKVSLAFVVAALGVLSLASLAMFIGNSQAEPLAGFSVAQYCGLYRSEFGVSYCPAQPPATIFTAFAHVPYVEAITVVATAALLLSGLSLILVERRGQRELLSKGQLPQGGVA